MRPIRYLLDLPWWAGLVIFLLGNMVAASCYVVGLPVCLFGTWTYSKLLAADDDPVVGCAMIGFPLFFIVMLIPDKFSFANVWASWLNGMTPTVLFGIRAALGIGVGFLAFRGVRK